MACYHGYRTCLNDPLPGRDGGQLPSFQMRSAITVPRSSDRPRENDASWISFQGPVENRHLRGPGWFTEVRFLGLALPLSAGKINRAAGGTKSQFWGPALVRVTLPGPEELIALRSTPYASQRCTNLGVTAAIAQLAERILGKDEVVGSYPTGGLGLPRNGNLNEESPQLHRKLS